MACLDVLLCRATEAAAAALASGDPYSPWHGTNGWRLNSDNHHVLTFTDGHDTIHVTAHYRPGGYLLDLPGGSLLASGTLDEDGDLCADLGGVRSRATVVRVGLDMNILSGGHSYLLTLDDPALHAGEQEGGGGRLTAPMPGKIVALPVDAGATVTAGTPLIVLEAMKMEHTIKAPADGCVVRFPYSVGDMVSEGDELVVFAAGDEDPDAA